MKDLKSIIKFTNKMKLLYVEDEQELREITTVMLEELFAEVITAHNGEDGLEKFYNNEIDIVLTDINMPVLDGLEMAEKIRAFDKNIPIVMLSAHNEAHYFTRSIELDVDGYLLKPIAMKFLLGTLSKIVTKLGFLEEYQNNLTFLEQYQALTDNSSAVSKTDIHGVITYVNDGFCKISGYTKEELIGAKHSIVRHPDSEASIYAELWNTIKFNKQTWKGMLRNKTKDDDTYYVDIIIQPILDQHDEIVEYISIKRNITDIISPKKQLHDFIDSAKDPLVVLMKIDGFFEIEKLYGHKLVEEIERNFENDLEFHMPEYLHFKKFFALGNGQYAFAQDLENNSEYTIDTIADELKGFQSIMNGLKMDIGEIDYDIAILISLANGEECLENAQSGIHFLVRSKQSMIVANDFAKKEQEEALKNLQVLKMVKLAIDNAKIISFFQPIVCNKTQETVKYESLVRLVDEDENVISPFFFLDIAKKGKYYARITDMVLENSFNALGQTDKAITINISALDIEKESTRGKIYELLDLHKTSTSRIVFELLEDEDVRDFEQIEEFISKVKSYGVKIAIDDFGAGYSNFERLLKYQPDILKIDGSLIKNIETDSYSMSVVKSIVAFAKEQEIEMVAEYIENENIYDILKDLGVEYSQGYYFGKPDLMASY